jgi:hypothetical protein
VASTANNTLHPYGPALKAACQAGWTDFLTWHKNAVVRDEGLSRLKMFSKIMQFEANRPYEQWYNSKEHLELDSTEAKALIAVADDKAEKAEFKAYVRCAKKGKWS